MIYHNFNRTDLDAFVRSSLDARDELVQYRIFWSCASGRRISPSFPRFQDQYAATGLPFYALRWQEARYPDRFLDYVVDRNHNFEYFIANNFENPYLDDGTPPEGMVTDTDPIRLRIWAYEIPGKQGPPIVTQIPWESVPPPSAIEGLGKFRGRAEVSGYALDRSSVRLPTITGEQYGEAYRHGRNIADDLFLAWEAEGPITITGGGGTGAAAHIVYTATGNIDSIVIDEPGNGYTSAPTVNGARAKATIEEGKVVLIELLGNRNSDVRPWNVDIKQNAIIGFGTGRVAFVNITNGGSGYVSIPDVKFIGTGTVNAVAHAVIANGSVKQVIIDNHGDGYLEPPLVVIGSGLTGTFPAFAEAVLTYKVSILKVRNSGSGYTEVPDVTISGGGGSGAAAHAVLSGSVTSIAVTHPGGGYTVGPPRVVITGGGGTDAFAVAEMSDDHVIGITILNPGSGYTSAPTISFIPTVSDPALATATVTADTSVELILDDGGSDYTSAPTVEIDPPDMGTPAIAEAALGDAEVTVINILFAGEGYPSPPAVSFIGGGGSGLTAHTTLGPGGSVASIVIDNPGTDYSSPPAVHFDNINGATATAVMDTLYQSFGTSGYSLTNQSNRVVIELDEFNDSQNNGQFWGYGFNGTIFADALDADDYKDPYFVSAQQAAAVAVMTLQGHVDSITITDPGTGYGKKPQISFVITAFDPDITNVAPTGTAVISGGQLIDIFITSQGEGYLGVAIKIDPPQFTRALASCRISGSVDHIVVDSKGSDYFGDPTVTIDGNATAHAIVENGQVVRVLVDNAGSGYEAPPAVTLSGNAKAHAVLDAHVTQVLIAHPGLGYVNPPQVRFAYGNAVAETEIEHTEGTVSLIRVTDGGSSYTEAPLVYLEIPDPQEVQKPEKERVRLFVLLVPGGYDPNHNFIPNLAAGNLPCFWLDQEISGNTYYNYWEVGTALQSHESIIVQCSTPWTFYGSIAVSGFLIPPIPFFGERDAFGHDVQGGDFWWFAGPPSQLGGGAGYGAYTVNSFSQAFWNYEGYDYCGGVNNDFCNQNFDKNCAWYIYWDYSDSMGSVGLAHTDINHGLLTVNYFITSTHSPRHLRDVTYIPNSNQIFGKIAPGTYWLPIPISVWTTDIFVDTPASFDPTYDGKWPPVVPGGLFDEFDGVPPYFFPLTYGVHNYSYIGYYYGGLNTVFRYGITTIIQTETPDLEVMTQNTYVALITDEWSIINRVFINIMEDLVAKTKTDMSFLVEGIIAGGAPYFGAAYRFRDIDFTIATQVYTAKAHAIIEGGEVIAVIVDYPGQDYGYGVPGVSFVGGGGSGASAYVAWTEPGTFIGPLILTSGGSGYTSPPEVLIDPPVHITISGWRPTKGPSRP